MDYQALNEAQRARIIDLVWDVMKKDKDHKDRVQTSWGAKTKAGLVACIERIINE